MNRTANKTAIMPGGTVGIGRACDLRFAQRRASVAIFDVLAEKGASRAARGGHQAAFRPVDVTDEPKFVAGADGAIDGGDKAR
ncbi:MAG: hypothetical protein ACK4GC_05850 [Paracoccaceae bacterium]